MVDFTCTQGISDVQMSIYVKSKVVEIARVRNKNAQWKGERMQQNELQQWLTEKIIDKDSFTNCIALKKNQNQRRVGHQEHHKT